MWMEQRREMRRGQLAALLSLALDGQRSVLRR